MASMTVVRSAPTGGERPVDIVFTPDGRRAYVSHGRSADVRVLDVQTLAVVAVIPVGPRAWWMALAPDGAFLWVTIGRARWPSSTRGRMLLRAGCRADNCPGA